MGQYSSPNVPFVEARATGKRHRPSVIALDPSFTSTEIGAAYALAVSMNGTGATTSYHYVVDSQQTYRCVPESNSAYFNDDSKKMLGVLVCDDPKSTPGRWYEHTHEALLAEVADVVAQLCLIHDIRPRYLSEPELKKWQKWRSKRRGGILLHDHMTKGSWPEDYFMRLVNAHIAKHKLVHNK